MDGELTQYLIDYCHDVISGEIIACQKHKWACERFLRDIDRQGTEEFPFILDADSAMRFLEWMTLFKHRKGVLAGEHIEPHEIQIFVFSNIYGWVHEDTGLRRFQKFYWQVARKNAKSQSLAIMALYEASAFGEPAAEVICAATKKEKSRIVWSEADTLSRQPLELKGKFKTSYGVITHLKSESTIKALSKEDRKDGDGDNPQCGIIDEYHAHETTEIYDVVETGMGARKQPIMGTITTAGLDLNAPCYVIEYRYVSQILNPYNPIENDSYFVMINELEVDDQGKLLDDIRDESAWIKANPIVCSYPEGIAQLRKKLQEALDVPEKMRNFLTKRMDVWVQMKPGGYMQMDKWAACGIDETPDTHGHDCTVGIDLSSKIDLTSVGFEIKLSNGKYVVHSHSFMPEDTLTTKRNTDKVPYDLWVLQKWITVTPGAVVDYRFIATYIKETAEERGWTIREICFDPYNATQFAQELMDDGYECVEIRQGVKTLSEPTKNFREEVYAGNVIHNNNPVLTWTLGNAVIRQDHNENIMLDKDKSGQRIDPATSLINAHVRGMLMEEASVYESRASFRL